MREFPGPGGNPGAESVARRAKQRRPTQPQPSRSRRSTAPLPAELVGFQGIVDPALLEAAARRAAMLGVGGDEVLRCHRLASPDQIARMLARSLGVETDPLDGGHPTQLPPSLAAARNGVVERVDALGRRWITLAPRGTGIRKLARALAANPRLAKHVRIAPPERLARYVRRAGAVQLARKAIRGLYDWRPDLSALVHGRHRLRWLGIPIGAAMSFLALLWSGKLLFATQCVLAASFLSWTGFRLYACGVRPTHSPKLELPDRSLPLYTIIVPLYREARVVPQFVTALNGLRYPREKLDIKLVLEPHDRETRAAVEQLDLPPPFEIITAPAGGPRTKPKALAAALPFARGSFTVVYDAEDEPEADQLRTALAAFVQGAPNLACVQARLAIDNARDSWISRQFAAEYAGLFDVFLPALAAKRMPLPLGGTSNHFRTDILRRLGGWDPYNVTEDADLGMRLARFGYRCDVIDSTTWEEAPVALAQWLRQRTRWFKGWMQTCAVHMRHPLRLFRELGWRDFAAFQLLMGGTVLSALVHPFFLAFVLNDLVSGTFFAKSETAAQTISKSLALITLGVGYVGAAALGWVGLYRRRMLGSAWVLALIPIYWWLLSVAAMRALYHFIGDRYGWEKTEHGLARTSLRKDRVPSEDREIKRTSATAARAARRKPRSLA